MHLNPVFSALWISSSVLCAIALGIVLRWRLFRAWPSLLFVLSLELLLSAVLFSVRSHPVWYFYVFWGGSALQSAGRLWVLADALRSIPGTSFIPSSARLIVLSAAVVMGIGAGIVTWTGQVGWVLYLHSPAKFILQTVILYNRAVSLACLTLCAVVLVAVFLIGLGWDRTGARVVSGLALELVELALRSTVFLESSHRLRLAADIFDSLTHMFVLLIWSYALLPRPLYPPKVEHP